MSINMNFVLSNILTFEHKNSKLKENLIVWIVNHQPSNFSHACLQHLKYLS